MPHRFRALFNHVQDAVWMAGEDGRIAEVNPAALARFAFRAQPHGPCRLLFTGLYESVTDDAQRR
jgi:PAS domain-containing protein